MKNSKFYVSKQQLVHIEISKRYNNMYVRNFQKMLIIRLVQNLGTDDYISNIISKSSILVKRSNKKLKTPIKKYYIELYYIS